jgi:23S rRNA (cytosine1962-C5)-methyltransferase
MKTNYELLDTGNRKRLERFGDKIVLRDAKQAEWKPSLPKSEWDKAHLRYENDEWSGDMSEFYGYFDDVTFNLKPMSMGQIGIFPEQAENWAWLKKVCEGKDYKIINGFAYTGGSSLFSSNSETEVCHLDGAKTSVNHAKLNFEVSDKLENKVRFIVDDVLTFMEKEVKRGKKYDGFIFDPPAFGRGGKGKTWKLSRDIDKLVSLIEKLSQGKPKFILLSAHDPSMTSKDLADKIFSIKGIFPANMEHGDLVMPTSRNQNMYNGYFARWSV